MRRLRTTSPSHATSALAVLTLLGTITACSMFGANTAVAASPPAQSPHHAGVVLDSGTSSNSNAGISQTTGSNSSHGSGGSTGSTGASVPKGLESFYHQDLTWTDCTDDATGTAFQCATVTVPLDYDNPQGQTITVALKKLPSTSSSPRGSVFLNPGGPGGSGISVIESQAELYKSGDLSEVLANYDVIGFDPRGVGQSTPITCWTPEDVQAILAGQAEVPFSPLTPGSAADIVTQGSREAAACEEHTEVPEILDHADTRSVARDMDVMRALVGDKDLNYLGYSYGTYLGAVYTELFPDNIGRVVLDSAMDPTMARQDPMEGDAAAGEQSLRTYIESQQGQAGFPLSGTTDAAVAQLATFLDGLDADPLTVSGSGTPLNRAKAVDAISKLVTTSPDKWPLLTEGLTQAMNAHDGSALKANADAVSATAHLPRPRSRWSSSSKVSKSSRPTGASTSPTPGTSRAGMRHWPPTTTTTRSSTVCYPSTTRSATAGDTPAGPRRSTSTSRPRTRCSSSASCTIRKHPTRGPKHWCRKSATAIC